MFTPKRSFNHLLILIFLCANLSLTAQQPDLLCKKIQLQGGRQTVYSLLNSISDASGLMFIYDSKLVDNNKKIKISRGERTVKEAILEALENQNFEIKIIGRHLLICKAENKKEFAEREPLIRHHITHGLLVEKTGGEPLSFCSIDLFNSSIATISNLNGQFELKIPDSLLTRPIIINHIGFKQKSIPANILSEEYNTIVLEPQNIDLKEVVIREADPKETLLNLLNRRNNNYINTPAYYTTYYREGVEYKNTLKNFTEAVFKIYKAPQESPFSNDQVKLLRKRTIKNVELKDTIDAKILAGINACLQLDIVKQLRDYLLSLNNLYKYSSARSEYIDSSIIDVIKFEPAKENRESLYRGILYIDKQSGALLKANIELFPNNIDKATESFVAKQGKVLKIVPEKITYEITYRLWNKRYHVSHIRGDLLFKVKKRRKWFNSSLLHSWFEMLTCKIETSEVTKFKHKELVETYSVFSEENKNREEEAFWGTLNIIPREEELNKNINSISSIIEKTIRK